MNNILRIFTLSFVAIFVLTGCRNNTLPESVTIRIITTSDVHGALFPYDLVMDKPTGHSLAQVSSYVAEQRENADQWVILLDNGDILQGDPLIYYYNFHRTDEAHIVAQTMNFMRYDAATVGNHDIEPGPEVYNKVNDEFNFPWMAANAIDLETKAPYFKPYTVLEQSGVKVAVLGLITPGIPRWLPRYTWEGMRFDDMIVSAAHWVEEIRTKENPDVLVGLFHSGVDYTYGNQDAETPLNENASLLIAEQIPGFDVIFVGHDHRGWNKFVPNNYGGDVLIAGTTSNARNVAEAIITLTYDHELKQYRRSVEGNLVDMSAYEPNEAFIEQFNHAFEKAKAFVARPIGQLTTDLSTRPMFFGDAAFTDLLHQIQLDITGADMSFNASQSFDLTIEAGPLHVRDMFKFQRYENLLYKMTLSGQEIKDYLEFSYGLWYNKMSGPDDNLLRFRRDADGNLIKRQSGTTAMLEHPFWNLDSAEGINYSVDVSQPVGNRINILSFSNGNAFHLNDTYTVAINSYRGNGGGDHLTNGAGIPHDQLHERVTFSTEKDLRWLAIQWIEKSNTITPKASDNWRVIPEIWWQSAKSRDYELMFGAW
jgi:2',3'-cyclic-nucleotide 2'-phosphodiesterase / 3'-nucleotidase